MTTFSNHDIDASSIPQLDHAIFNQLKPSYKWVLLFKTLIFNFIIICCCLVAFFVFSIWSSPYFNYAIAAIILFNITTFLMSFLAFKKKKWAFREHDLIYKSGVIWKSEEAVPFNRVQHIDLNKGPIDDIFEVTKLTVYTAGDVHLTIPGLAFDSAKQMRDYIITRSQYTDEEE